jgi:hypothetical protein
MRRFIPGAALALLAACGDGAGKPTPVKSQEVAGFDFEIAVEPATFVPATAAPVKIARDGDAKTNPPGTVQLYTPNDTLTWLDGANGDIFGFDVELTNFYAAPLCAVRVVVDAISPPTGRAFVADDRGTSYAAGVTGAGVWAYGDLAPKAKETRRWQIRLRTKERFTLTGRVLADAQDCAGPKALKKGAD